jgi:hypothetical protein
MMNMKCLNKILLLTKVIILLPLFGLTQPKLSVKWGIENTEFFKESQATKEQNSAFFPNAKKSDKKYRFINTTSMYNDVIQKFFERHWKLWNKFKKQSSQDTMLTKLNFVKYAKSEDPYYYGIAKSLAPRLYFDFIGESQEYVLESIEIKTISFDEYSGGGFSDKEAWYDIELKHIPGIYIYPVDSKLRFTGSGRTVLRFWSDNYYKAAGMTPSGCYMVSIKFNFLINGIKTSVSTEPFKIDV